MSKQFRLPKQFTIRWLDALRSGKYNQGVGQLRSTVGYCCLGVACSILGVPDDDLKGVSLVRSKGDVLSCLPVITGYPNELIWYDTRQSILVDRLTSMNDNGTGFEGIARWIEENVELYDEEVQTT